MNFQLKQLRTSLAIITLSFCAQNLAGQFELKTGPLAFILLEGVQIGVEKPLNQSWGIDIDLLAISDELYATTAGKYYMRPKNGADGFHIGAFVGGGFDLGFGGGFMLGYKLLSKNGILFEVGGGIGRSIFDVLPYGKVHLGYRINRSKLKKVVD